MGPSKAKKPKAATSKDVCAWFMDSSRSDEEDEEKSKEHSRIDEGNTKMKGDKEDEDSTGESTKRRSKRLSANSKNDKNNEQGSSSTTTQRRPKNEEQLDTVELKENEDDDDDEDYEDQSDDDDEKTKTDEETCQSDDDDDERTKKEEKRWSAVTPEMLKACLGRNSNWSSASTISDVVGYLRENYPVCRRDEELTVEVTDKLKCAEDICLVVKESTTGEGDPERVVNSYRLASPPEKTFLSELEVKEFWSKYKEILRRSRRQMKSMDNARMTRSRQTQKTQPRVSTRSTLRTTTNKEKQNKKTTTTKKSQYRRRSPYRCNSSDGSLDGSDGCCCWK